VGQDVLAARFHAIIAPAGFGADFARLLAVGGSEAASPEALCAIASESALEVDPTRIFRIGPSARTGTGSLNADACGCGVTPEESLLNSC
jgi:hypothetical protein